MQKQNNEKPTHMHVSLTRIKTEQYRIRKNRLFQLEGTCSSHLVQLSEQFRANQKLKDVVEGTVQMPLKL